MSQPLTERDWFPACLSEDHEIADFTCGEESLDRWLKREARAAHSSGASRTHVWTASGSPAVKAYYTITPTSVEPEGLSTRNRGGLSGTVPGYLLAKLALCTDLRGQDPRLGPDLLLDALETVVTAANAAGGRLIVVDTMNDRAHEFYRRADFQPIPSSDRLVMRVSTARAVLSRS